MTDALIVATLAFLVLTNLALLGLSRLTTCVRVVAVQGVVLGLFTLAIHGKDLTLHPVALASGSVLLKGMVIPWLLFHALREASVRREVEPYVGYLGSTLIGVLALLLSLWIGNRLPLPSPVISPLVVPVALFTIIIGLFLIVSRKKAVTQVLGYLVLENGIYAFGVALVLEEPFLVELGVLLDVFVAVFVMGITMFQIQRTFDHIDTDQLSTLKD